MTYLHPPPGDAPVIVMKDVGGYVNEYAAQTRLYFETGREVRLHECRSACTLALSLPNVCVYPQSLLKFHKAYDIHTKVANEEISDQLMSSYPSAVRERLRALTRQYQVLTGSELIRLGIRDCNRPLAPNYAIARARVREAPSDGSSLFGSLVSALSSSPAPTGQAPIRAQTVRIQTAGASTLAPPIPPSRPDDLTTPPAPAVAPQPENVAPTPTVVSRWGRPIIGSAPILVSTHFAPYIWRAARI